MTENTKIMNQHLKNTVFFLVFLLLPLSSFAQYPFLSQYNNAPLYYNPASIISESPEVSAAYRNADLAGRLNYTTMTANVYLPLKYRFEKVNAGTLAFSMFNEGAGQAHFLNSTGFMINYTQQVSITRFSSLKVGILGSYLQRKFDRSGLSTGSQWVENTGFDPSLSNGEELISERSNAFSVGSGIEWRRMVPESRSVSHLGFAAYNLNRPYEGFINEDNRMPIRLVASAGHSVYTGPSVTLTPQSILLYENNLYLAGAGITANCYFKGDNPFVPLQEGHITGQLDVFTNRTMTGTVQLNQPAYTVGMSYQFNTSQATSMPGKANAIELFLGIKLKRKSGQQARSNLRDDHSLGEIRVFYEEEKDVPNPEQKSVPENKETEEAESPPEAEKSKSIAFELKKDFKFSFNEVHLSEEAREYLDELAALLGDNPSLKLEVIGHTDDVGTREANREISEKRAVVVADYLISIGVDEHRIKTTGKSDQEPLYPNNNADNRAKNRRVEFILYH